MTEPMRIVALRVQNFKRLKDIEIEPDRNCIIIGGNNGHGKSSVIDSIITAIGGQRMAPTEPIRRGASKASIRVDLGEIVIEEVFTKSGARLEVRDKDGTAIKSPQATLDALRGNFLLDPVEFLGKKDTERAEMLRKLIGLDFSDLEDRKRARLDEKAEAERTMKTHERNLAAMPVIPDAPAERIDEEAISLKFDSIRSQQRELDALREVAEKARQKSEEAAHEKECLISMGQTLLQVISMREEQIAHLKAEIEAKKKEADELDPKLQEAIKLADDATETYAAASRAVEEKKVAIPDVTAIAAELKEAQTANAKLAKNEEREKIAKALKVAARAVDQAKSKIDDVSDERKRRLSEAPFPVPGLGFDEAGGVTFNGLPLDQASGAEKLRVAVGISLAGKSRIRFVPIKDGSLLDAESLEMIRTMVVEADAQTWIERVGKGDEVSVIIEDGSILEEAAS